MGKIVAGVIFAILKTMCEMDTVIGKTSDTQCILTLHLRACKLQFCLLLPEKTTSATAVALGSLETSLRKDLFEHLFGLILTDNGTEFADCDRLEKSVFPGKTTRTKVYYCGVRQSQQKGGCVRNHMELRKLLPKRSRIRFDMLDSFDMAIAMSQLHSEPRPSLMGLSPFAMFKAVNSFAFAAFCTTLGIEEIAYEKLELTIKAINKAREKKRATASDLVRG